MILLNTGTILMKQINVKLRAKFEMKCNNYVALRTMQTRFPRTRAGSAEPGPGQQERHLLLGPGAPRPVPAEQPQLRDKRPAPQPPDGAPAAGRAERRAVLPGHTGARPLQLRRDELRQGARPHRASQRRAR